VSEKGDISSEVIAALVGFLIEETYNNRVNIELVDGGGIKGYDEGIILTWPWDVGSNLFEPTWVIGCSKILMINNLLQKWKRH